MVRTKNKRSKKKHLLENSTFGTLNVEKTTMKKKKKKSKNKKNALLVLNTSCASPSNPSPTPTQAVASTSLSVPSMKTKVHESKTKRRDKNENKPGYIFMCNRKTKPECYRYRIFGLPRGKFDVVKNIEPGMKLFLYDFDSKFLYGVYEASSMGALDLEPCAFNGLFPAQVKFNILKDSLPLPESTFRHAIKDNYQGGNKFKQELSPTQVKSLISMFRDIVVAPSAPTVPLLPHPIAPPNIEEGARYPPSENPYFSRPRLDTKTLHFVQHREGGSNGYRTYVAPPMMEEEARFPPSVKPYFSRPHYLQTIPPHDTEMQKVIQHRDRGLHEHQTYVAGLQPSVESMHVVQSEAVYDDKRYHLPEAYQPYVPDNPTFLSPDPYKRNLRLTDPRDHDIGGTRFGSNYYNANLAGERKPLSPVNYAYSPANFARERNQPLNLGDYPRPPGYYGQHLHPTTSNVSVPAHGAHPHPGLQHLPPHGSYYTPQNPDLLHHGMTQRTVHVSYGDIEGNTLVASYYSSAGVAPSYPP